MTFFFSFSILLLCSHCIAQVPHDRNPGTKLSETEFPLENGWRWCRIVLLSSFLLCHRWQYYSIWNDKGLYRTGRPGHTLSLTHPCTTHHPLLTMDKTEEQNDVQGQYESQEQWEIQGRPERWGQGHRRMECQAVSSSVKWRFKAGPSHRTPIRISAVTHIKYL